MKKMTTLYHINYVNHIGTITQDINPENVWVFEDKENIIATAKKDGTACRITVKDIQLILWKRYDRKLTKKAFFRKKKDKTFIPKITDYKPISNEFEVCNELPDPITGHWPGWLPTDRNDNADQYHIEAWDRCNHILEPGTYELVGPKIQGNPYNLEYHELWKHGAHILYNVPLEFHLLKEYLRELHEEGIVFHHTDERMCKIRRKDFGFNWPINR